MRVTDFRYTEDLHLVRHRQGEGHLFYLAKPYRVAFKLDGEWTSWTVHEGTATDFASIPKAVPRWIVDKLGPHVEAAVVHDDLCYCHPWDYKVAAEVFLAAMAAANVPEVTRNLMYRAVLIGGPRW